MNKSNPQLEIISTVLHLTINMFVLLTLKESEDK